MLNEKKLGNLTLGHKLWLLISLPIAIMIVYAALFSYEQIKKLDNADNVHNLATATSSLNALIHELQYERGKAITYVADQNSESLLEWLSATKRSDASIKLLSKTKNEFIKIKAEDSIIEAFSTIVGSIDEIKNLRKQIESKKEINFSLVESVYTAVIRKIHGYISSFMTSIPGSQTYQLIDALMSISDLKEITGMERALGSAILTTGIADVEYIERLSNLGVKIDFNIDKFMGLAPAKFQKKYFSLGIDKYKGEKKSLLKRMINLSANEKINGDADKWFDITSEQINKYMQLEDEIAEKLIYDSTSKQEQANQLLMISLVLSLCILIVLYLVVFVATKRLTLGIFKLRDSAVKFVDTGELYKVDVASEDELGQVSTAFNKLIDELESIRQLLERVSEGDFNQSVIEKGENDRLSKSLNHMIKTLNTSVKDLREQNWLKTGQSDLTAQLNSDQSVQSVATRSISFISSYLNAAVGAIYLVDDDGKSSLFASYAYTNRKDGRNEYEKGESLVGQVVMEKKPIIIEEIPQDYISVTSGLGKTVPASLIIFPLIYANKVLSVVELATLKPLDTTELEFIEKIATDLAVAIHSAVNREKMIALLEETQMQSEELQGQQDELEKNNLELSEQANKLVTSQDELKQQKLELLQSNDELRINSEALEQKNKEVEVRSQELATASKYKSEFLANMSHELRTPLNSLLLLSQTLKENDEQNLTTDQIEALKIIYGSGKDLLSLINDILDLSKVEAGKMIIDKEEYDLYQILGQIRSQFLPMAKEKSLEFTIDIDTSVDAKIYTDSIRLQQILRNLISNAIKFTDQGYVRVSVKNDHDSNLVFRVEDSGIGIPEKLKHAIFEAFQQGDGSTRRKYSGTGLGLTISREMAHLLGGDIVLGSDADKGAVFNLIFPLDVVKCVDDGEKKVIESIEEKPRLSSVLSKDLIESDEMENTSYSILIVEDDKNFSGLLEKTAADMGFRSYQAFTLKQAYKILNQNKPDAILLDMLLPDGNGEDFVKVLNSSVNTSSIPFYIISSMDKDSIHCDGSIGISTKPISKEAIEYSLHNIQRLIRGSEKMNLLVIEDDAAAQASIEYLLKNKNINLIPAMTGNKGMSILQSEKIDCIILDLNLPDADNEVTQKAILALSKQKNIHLIIYTGADLSHEEYKKFRQYTDHIIIKGTVSQERLLSDVTEFLAKIERSGLPQETSNVIGSDNSTTSFYAGNDKKENLGGLEGVKVLVVDDDMRNTFALSGLLKRYGMEVIMADNGHLALEKLDEKKGIQVALMDIMMPIMDGYETIKKIRKGNNGYQDLPIIALTAKAMPEDKEKCLTAGANDYLSKPVDSHQLISALKIWVNQ